MLKAKKLDKEPFDEEKVYDRIDFSQLHSIADAFVQLLPDSPPFYSSGNFREKFSTQFLRNTKEAKRVLSKKLDVEVVFLQSQKHLRLIIIQQFR